MIYVTPGMLLTLALYAMALVAVSFWVARSYKNAGTAAMGAVGLAALAVLPYSYVFWRETLVVPIWTAVVTFVVVAAMFIVGMRVNRNKDDLWHIGALLVSLFLMPLLAAADGVGGWLMGILSGETTLPNWVWFTLLLIVLIFAVLPFGRRKLQAHQAQRRQNQSQPATSTP